MKTLYTTIKNALTAGFTAGGGGVRYLPDAVACSLLAVYTLFLMHVRIAHPSGTGMDIPQSVLAWMLAGVWWILAAMRPVFWRGWRRESFLLLCLAGIIVLSIPWLYAPHTWRYQSDLRVAGLSGGMLLMVSARSLFSSPRARMLVLYLLLAGASLQAIAGIAVMLCPGMTLILLSPLSHGRVVGIFGQPNVLASFLGTGLMLAGYLWLTVQTRCGTTPADACRQGKRCALLLATALLSICLPLTQSSQVWLISLAVMLLMAHPLLTRNRSAWLWLAVVLAGVVVGTALWSFTRGAPVEHEAGRLGRMQIWSSTLWLLWQRPWLGWGYGHFEMAYVYAWMTTGAVDRIDHALMRFPHNELLYWLAEGGLVAGLGLACIIAAGVVLFCRSRKQMLSAGGPGWQGSGAYGLVCCSLPLFMHSMTEYPFYQSSLHYITALLLLTFADMTVGTAPGADNSAGTWARAPQSGQFGVRLTLLAAGAGTVFWMLTALNTGMQLTLAGEDLEAGRGLSPAREVALRGVHSLNPYVMKERFWRVVALGQAYRAQVKGDTSLIPPLIRWENFYLERHPDPEIAALRIRHLKMTGQEEAAERAREEGARMYPWDLRFRRGAVGTPDNALPVRVLAHDASQVMAAP